VQQHLSLQAIPRWARIPDQLRDSQQAAFQTGAALALLNSRVMAESVFAGVWRRRLALKAAAASARMARRGEHEEMLRDAFYLRMGAEDGGPAGRLLDVWRLLDRSAALADDDAIGRVVEALQLKMDDGLRGTIAEARVLASSDRPAPVLAAEVASFVTTRRPDAEVLALWLADAVLAARLAWPMPLPLLAAALMHPSLRSDGRRPWPGAGAWIETCWVAYGRAAAHASDLFGELERQSNKLLAVAPQLRAKQAPAVIEMLHNDDAVLPSAVGKLMTDRAARRLFDRLVELGAVRELTGRPTFRLYGL
jgi:hypothetical protein